VQVNRLKAAATARFLDNIPGLNKARSLAAGVAVASGVLHGLAMADSLRIGNPYVQGLARATRRAKGNGNLSTIDEVEALDDFYQLTNDPFAAAWAWNYWREGLYK
jgi:hypothetical protein